MGNIFKKKDKDSSKDNDRKQASAPLDLSVSAKGTPSNPIVVTNNNNMTGAISLNNRIDITLPNNKYNEASAPLIKNYIVPSAPLIKNSIVPSAPPISTKSNMSQFQIIKKILKNLIILMNEDKIFIYTIFFFIFYPLYYFSTANELHFLNIDTEFKIKIGIVATLGLL